MAARNYSMTLTTSHSTVELLQEALHKKGYKFEKFELRGSSYTRFIAPNGQVWLTQDTHIGYPFSSSATAKISIEKDLAYEFCAAEGVRVPATWILSQGWDDSQLTPLLKRHPLVVKPANASLSKGVSVDITNLQGLRTAVKAALKCSPRILVQEQIEGEELRFTVVNGKVRAVLLRQKPGLDGDGTSTIGELLARENEARANLRLPFLTYPQLSSQLISLSGHKAEDILSAGERIRLGRGTMVRTGASIYNVLADVHETYLAIVTRLVAALGDRFIVVDMIIRDYTQPLTKDNYAFIEFNKAPVLKLFYSCRDGKHYDIIRDLVPMIDVALTRGEP